MQMCVVDLAFRKRLVDIVTPLADAAASYDQSNGHLHIDSCEVRYTETGQSNLYLVDDSKVLYGFYRGRD